MSCLLESHSLTLCLFGSDDFLCFKYTLFLDSMQLGYVGYVRAMAGSIPMQSETSSIFLSKLWSNKLKYGITKYNLFNAHKSHLDYWKNYFKNNKSRCNKSPLVDPFLHSFDFYKCSLPRTIKLL